MSNWREYRFPKQMAYPPLMREAQDTYKILSRRGGNRLGRIQLQKLPALAEVMAKITRKVPVVLLERKK